MALDSVSSRCPVWRIHRACLLIHSSPPPRDEQLAKVAAKLEVLGMKIRTPESAVPLCGTRNMTVVIAVQRKLLPAVNDAVCKVGWLQGVNGAACWKRRRSLRPCFIVLFYSFWHLLLASIDVVPLVSCGGKEPIRKSSLRHERACLLGKLTMQHR